MNQFQRKIELQKCKKMAEEIEKHIKLSKEVKEAIAATQREIFVPLKHYAYKLEALPLSSNQWISSPLTVAKMTQALETKSADSVLEIGCGSGYQAAILSRLIRRVFTIERIEKLLKEAKQRFKDLNITNIHTRFDDGQNGWKTYAPFDRILISASIAQIPQKLFDQLNEGGILVAPIEKNDKQIITKFVKKEKIYTQEIDECLFVPVVKGVQK